MNKKNGLKKLLGMLLLLASINIVVFGAINLHFKGINVGLNVIDINFSGPGNNFLGSLLIDKIVDLTGSDIQTITLNGEIIICSKQILGLYFNSQRGNRLRPLDQGSFDQLKEISTSYDDLTTLEGGLFTNCSGADASSIFGQVKHIWKSETYYIVAGTKLDYDSNKFIASFADSFQLFDVNQGILSLGFIWDNYGGIGLVGGPSKIRGPNNLIDFLNSAGGSIKSGFIYSGNSLLSTNIGLWRFQPAYLDIGGTNLFWNLFVRGNVGISSSYQDKNTLPTTTQSEALLFNLSDVNISTLVNAARKNSSSLCRDKWMTGSYLILSNSDILCFKNTNLNIDLDGDANLYGKKTIVLVSGNVIATNSMKGINNPLELFIDKGNLYLENPSSIDNLEVFDGEGYPDNIANFQAEFLKGVFIVNGLIIGSGSTGPVFQHKLVIHGRITSLNSPEPTAKRKQQVTAVLGAGFDSMIDLDNIFVRSCSYGGTGSDLTRCNGAGDVVKKPFVIIDNLDKSMKYKLLNY